MSESLQFYDSRFRSAMVELRSPTPRSSRAITICEARDALKEMEREIASLPERDVWHTKVLSYTSMLEREERVPESKGETGTISLIDRALSQVEEARGAARDTSVLLAGNREKIENANAKIQTLTEEDLENAHWIVRKMGARDARQRCLVCALGTFLLCACGACVVILVGV